MLKNKPCLTVIVGLEAGRVPGDASKQVVHVVQDPDVVHEVVGGGEPLDARKHVPGRPRSYVPAVAGRDTLDGDLF